MESVWAPRGLRQALFAEISGNKADVLLSILT